MSASMVCYVVMGPCYLDIAPRTRTKIVNHIMDFQPDESEDDEVALKDEFRNTDIAHQFLDRLIKFWDKPYMTWDSASRIIGKKRIVFSGTSTWGDEPQGTGYQLLKRVDKLGIATMLKLEF
jgi:hypothetical protein